ncbi:MAG TPA: ClbS/DfsB family four-helix bundle protein [Thermomicrobiales bacterium]|nr:ClbS/DfsB family four-helix bundle protein [Thermomicrobiales bacterium]
MTQATNKEQVLDRIERERAFWEALLAEIGEGRMERPGAAGAWTFKDVAAHLNAWRRRSLARLEAGRRGQPVPSPEWPADLDDGTDEGTEQINAWIYQANRGRPLGEVLAESRGQFRQLSDIVAALPEEELTAAGRFPWMGGTSLAQAILGGDFFSHLHEEHEPAIRAWLASENQPE